MVVDSTRPTLDMGEVISKTFGVVGAHPGVFAILAFLFGAAPQFLVAFVTRPEFGFQPTGLLPFVLPFLGLLVFSVVGQAATVQATLDDLADGPVTLSRCRSAAVSGFLPLLVLTLVSAVAIGIGLVLLIVPGIILMTALAASAPSVIAERRGPLAAFSRSLELTGGHRWKIFGLLVIATVVGAIVGGIFGGLVGLTAGFVLPDDDTAALVAGQLIAQPLISGLSTMFGTVGGTVIYTELRRIKGGPGSELTEVFA